MLELLGWLCPAVTATEAEKLRAIDFAQRFRPKGLSAEKQDEAQAYYAGWLLTKKVQHQLSGAVPVGVVSEKEGDLSRTYGKSDDDPYGYLAAYNKLKKLSSKGAITVGKCQS